MSRNILVKLYNDNAGFVVSAELVLVATIAVLAMLVGLAEVSESVNQELEDVASAFGSICQTYEVKGAKGCKGAINGSTFTDIQDNCDNYCDIVPLDPVGER